MSKEKVNNLVMMPFTSDDKFILESNLFMCESLIYNYFIRSFDGDIGRIHATVVETKLLKAKDIPENKEYVKQVKTMGKKFAVEFSIDITPTPEEVEDEL